MSNRRSLLILKLAKQSEITDWSVIPNQNSEEDAQLVAAGNTLDVIEEETSENHSGQTADPKSQTDFFTKSISEETIQNNVFPLVENKKPLVEVKTVMKVPDEIVNIIEVETEDKYSEKDYVIPQTEVMQLRTLEYQNEYTVEGPSTSKNHSSSSSSDFSDPFSSDDSFKDPNYSRSYDSSSSSDESDDKENNQVEATNTPRRKVADPSLIEKKGKKRVIHKENWKKNSAKRKRNSGQSYVSVSKKKAVIDAKKLLPPCNDHCRLKCFSNISEEDRKKIFVDYWGLSDLEKQRLFLIANMSVVNPKYRYVREDSHRRPNNAFYFNINGRKIRVCKKFFKNTLCINDRPIRTVLKKHSLFTGQMLLPDLRGKHGHHVKIDENIKEGVRLHINSIPRIDSHYCRSSTKREFIEGGKTVAELHREYKLMCKENKSPAANYVMYSRIFNEEFNLSFFLPKKDQCELCTNYNNCQGEEKTNLQEKYDIHREETDLSRKEKENDKNSNSIVAVYDLQAVLPCPAGDASKFYYVSKLNVLNLTVCNIQSKDVQCYVWHEGEAQRGVNEIGSCILKYLEFVIGNASKGPEGNTKKINIIFYSDNCGGQQKNRFMFATYLYAVGKYECIESISHKFLITGHSQNEGDSAHSLIERQIKRAKRSGPVYIPEQYISLIRTAKKSGQPYKVNEISHEDIYDLKQMTSDMGLNALSKNENGDPVRISEIKVVKFMKEHENTIFYKESFKDENFKKICLNPRKKKFRNVYI